LDFDFSDSGRQVTEDDTMRIHNKVVLITGASEGIGAACAKSFGQRGARLSLVARSRETLEQVGRGGALITAGDITNAELRQRAVEGTLARFGSIDILINNAGVGLHGPAWRSPLPLARQMFELNLFAALAMIQLVVPHMKRQKSGTIVNVGSITGKVTLPWHTLYSASKYAIGSLTDGLRMELRADGIHAMTVCPGYVTTNFATRALGGPPPEKLPTSRRFAVSAEQCAEEIAKGVERRARTVVTPRIGWLFVALERLLPSFLDAQIAGLYETLEWRA
jgi:short-subunit dehydrogenase